MRAMAMILESGLSIQRRMNDVWVATFPVVKKQRKIKTYMLFSSNDNVLPTTAMINSNKPKKEENCHFCEKIVKNCENRKQHATEGPSSNIGPRYSKPDFSFVTMYIIFHSVLSLNNLKVHKK